MTIAEFKQRIFIIRQLLFGSFQTEYRRSFLGTLWLIFEPLFSVIIWIFLYQTGIIRPGASSVSYPAFVLISTSLWTIFLQSYFHTSSTLRSYQRIFLNIQSSPTTYGVAKLLFSSIVTLIPLLIVMTLMSFVSLTPSWSWILVPLACAPLFVLGASIGYVNSLLTIVSQDLSKLLSTFIRLLKYATPIIYTPDIQHPILQQVISCNPLSILVDVPRKILTGTGQTQLPIFLAISGGVLIMFLIALFFFQSRSRLLIERTIA